MLKHLYYSTDVINCEISVGVMCTKMTVLTVLEESDYIICVYCIIRNGCQAMRILKDEH